MNDNRLFDLRIISQAVGGDSESIKDMIRILLSTLPPYLKNIKKNIENENWEEVAKIAHTVKSNINMIGVKSSFYKIKEIEHLAKERKDAGKMASLFKEMENEMDKVFNELKIELDNL